ncbi:MAG: hypothetical protein E6R03_02260 [Hyphomicrobiaceae bacterium]|nr:MAG: hypothetical protein E6R03_02260 [Hyphomicrobiaceae bacterium]
MKENEDILLTGKETEPTYTYLAARVMVEIARTGDPYAYDRMLDRVMGKVPIKINYDDMAKSLSDEDLMELIQISVQGFQLAGPGPVSVPAQYKNLTNAQETQGQEDDGVNTDGVKARSPAFDSTEA